MSPYKNFLSTAKVYLNSNGFLRFLLSARIAVFALGGLFYLLGAFLVNIWVGGEILYDAFVTLGVVLLWAGLLLCIFAEDAMTVVIASGSFALCSLVAWIIALAVRGTFLFGPLFYSMAFGAVCIIALIMADKFVKMRAEAAARASVSCARCGAAIPQAASFCPVCGAPNPVIPYAPPVGQPYASPPPYAPPAPPPYAPPTPPPYTPPVPPPYMPPVPPPYMPPVPPPYTPPAPPPYTPPPTPPAEPAAEPDTESVAPAEMEEPSAPAEADGKKCVNCGAELPAGAVFCGKCGTRQ